MIRLLLLCVLLLPGFAQTADTATTTTNAPAADTNQYTGTVNAIIPPRNPLPSEDESASVTQFSFFVYGDTRGRRDGKEIQYEHSLIIDSMLANIKRLQKTTFPAKFVLQTGDAVVNGRDPKQWNNSFVSLINRITKDGGIPYFLAPGNHDLTAASEITNTARKGALTNYLNAVNSLIPTNGASRRLDGYPSFAFGYGNSFFIALDSNLGTNQTQLDWVTQQIEGLDRARYTNLFAFFHHPPFSSGGHGGSNIEAPALALRNQYMPVFRKHHVTALFAGHEHLFEHWIERYQDAATNKFRMDMIVTGGGGAPLYGYRGEPRTNEYGKAFAKEKVVLEHLVRPGPKPGDNPYHYIIVKVDGTRISVEVVGIDWGSGFAPYQSNKVTFD